MNTPEFIFFLFVQFCAGIIIGLTSFGGNLFAVPLMTLIMSTRDAILIGCLGGVPLICVMCFIYRKHILWADSITLGISGMICAPLGAWLLVHLNVRILLITASFAIFLFLLWQIISVKLSRNDFELPRWAAIPCGMLAGVMTSTTSMGGPPLVFYMYLRRWTQSQALGGLSIACVFQLIVTIYTQWQAGLYTREILILSFWASAIVCSGILCTIPIVKRMEISLFRKLVLFLLAISAVSLLIKAIVI